MKTQQMINIRTKKLGLLIYDARLIGQPVYEWYLIIAGKKAKPAWLKFAVKLSNHQQN